MGNLLFIFLKPYLSSIPQNFLNFFLFLHTNLFQIFTVLFESLSNFFGEFNEVRDHVLHLPDFFDPFCQAVSLLFTQRIYFYFNLSWLLHRHNHGIERMIVHLLWHVLIIIELLLCWVRLILLINLRLLFSSDHLNDYK
jgi:phage-related protein